MIFSRLASGSSICLVLTYYISMFYRNKAEDIKTIHEQKSNPRPRTRNRPNLRKTTTSILTEFWRDVRLIRFHSEAILYTLGGFIRQKAWPLGLAICRMNDKNRMLNSWYLIQTYSASNWNQYIFSRKSSEITCETFVENMLYYNWLQFRFRKNTWNPYLYMLTTQMSFHMWNLCKWTVNHTFVTLELHKFTHVKHTRGLPMRAARSWGCEHLLWDRP